MDTEMLEEGASCAAASGGAIGRSSRLSINLNIDNKNMMSMADAAEAARRDKIVKFILFLSWWKLQHLHHISAKKYGMLKSIMTQLGTKCHKLEHSVIALVYRVACSCCLQMAESCVIFCIGLEIFFLPGSAKTRTNFGRCRCVRLTNFCYVRRRFDILK